MVNRESGGQKAANCSSFNNHSLFKDFYILIKKECDSKAKVKFKDTD
ncbi:MAG: hypothetical protein H6627_09875 [Calditrichae bacterium]|nr:hypothetical protein [Calditrichia bacterium]